MTCFERLYKGRGTFIKSLSFFFIIKVSPQNKQEDIIYVDIEAPFWVSQLRLYSPGIKTSFLMERVQAILGACDDLDIDEPKNGACMDKPSHKQTQDDPNKYVQTIMEIFRLENVAKEDGSVDCDKVKDKLSRIKAHLKAQNLISQKGRAPNVNLKGLEL